jgi:hypothetical protein
MKLSGPSVKGGSNSSVTMSLKVFGLEPSDLPSKDDLIPGSIVVIRGASRLSVSGQLTWRAQCPKESQIFVFPAGANEPSFHTPLDDIQVDVDDFLTRVEDTRKWKLEQQRRIFEGETGGPNQDTYSTAIDPATAGMRYSIADLNSSDIMLERRMTKMNMVLEVIGSPFHDNKKLSLEVRDGSGSGPHGKGATYQLVVWGEHGLSLNKALDKKTPCWVHFGGIYLKPSKGSSTPELASVSELFCFKLLKEDDDEVVHRFERVSRAQEPQEPQQASRLQPASVQPNTPSALVSTTLNTLSSLPSSSPATTRSLLAYTPITPMPNPSSEGHGSTASTAMDVVIPVPERSEILLDSVNQNAPISHISELLTIEPPKVMALPQPFRIRARVFSVWPPPSATSIEDYLVTHCCDCFYTEKSGLCQHRKKKYAKSIVFTLILEHENHLLPVNVTGKAAEYFCALSHQDITTVDGKARLKTILEKLEAGSQLASFCIYAYSPEGTELEYSLFGTKYVL